MARFQARPAVTRTGAVALIFALGTGLPIAPAVAADPTPNLALSVSLYFDRDTYREDETTRLTVVLTNHGPDALTGVTARCSGSEHHPNLRGGAGWGQLAEGGAGVTVPGGGAGPVSMAFVVSEPVPPAAPRFGYVRASCSFGAAGYPGDVRAPAETTAQVPGIPGSGRGRIYQNLDDDDRVDDGEEVAGVTVVVTDPNTGAVVARPVTDARGGFAVDDLPAGVYSVRVAGPWKVQYDGVLLSWFRFPVVAGEPLEEQSFAVVPGSEQENNKPNLKVSGAFDRPAYNSGDVVRMRIVVTNIGEVAAEGVRVEPAHDGPLLDFPIESWGDFGNGTGVRIEAGATREIEIEGTIREPNVGAVVFFAGFSTANGEIDDTNNGFRIAATVTATRGTYAGTLYGDRNNNGMMDPGEGLGRATIELSQPGPGNFFSQATDANGRFAFRDIPSGLYHVHHYLPGGWVLPQSFQVIVDEKEHRDVLLRAVRPVSEVLTASVAFTKETYAVGETAHLMVTLTNKGSSELTPIKAFCSAERTGNELLSDGPGWGSLAENGPGITLRAGETRTIDVSNTVPEGAFLYGHVIADCAFGPMIELPGKARARDVAKVPGGIGTSGGMLLYDRNSDGYVDGDGVPNTKVVLLDTDTGKVVARAVTDANGRFLFENVPAFRYEFRVIGPWRLIDDAAFQVLSGITDQGNDKNVVPGALQPDPDAPPQAAPAPQGGVAPAEQSGGGGLLASTGVTVIGLSIIGLVMLTAGTVLVLLRRRRPAARQ